MKIEHAIKQQSSFRSEQERLIVNILYTRSYIEEQMRLFLAPYAITPQQFNVLRILRGQNHKAISLGDIRERMLDKMSDVSRLVDRLIKNGLAEKHRDGADRRQMSVNITEKGLSLLEVIDKGMHKLDDFLGEVSVHELFIANQILDKIRN